MRHLLNDHPGASLQGRRYGGTLQVSHSRSVSPHQSTLLSIASSHYQAYAAAKTQIPPKRIKDIHFCPHPEENRGVLTQRYQRK